MESVVVNRGAGVEAPAAQAVRNDCGRVLVGWGAGVVAPAAQAVRNDRGRVLAWGGPRGTRGTQRATARRAAAQWTGVAFEDARRPAERLPFARALALPLAAAVSLSATLEAARVPEVACWLARHVAVAPFGH